MSFSSPTERIRALIETARSAAAAAGRDFDPNTIYVRALMRCGIGRAEATDLLATGSDPVRHILHFAGDTHNFAVLAVEEAVAAA